MITLSEDNDRLLLTYRADGFNDAQWLAEKRQQYGKVILRRRFTFTQSERLTQPTSGDENDDAERRFLLGTLEGRCARSRAVTAHRPNPSSRCRVDVILILAASYCRRERENE